MLVLSRKIGESILIGSDIRVEVVRQKGDSVVLGISAPDSYLVLREELATSPEGRSSDRKAARKPKE